MIAPYPVSVDPPAPRIRPSLWWLVLAGVLMLGSVGGYAASVNSAVRGVTHTQRVNHSGPLELDGGAYTIYSTGPTVSIVDSRGRAVRTAGYRGHATYTASSVAYVAISTFTAARSGRYQLRLDRPGSVAIGPGLSTTAKTGFGFSALGMIAGLALGVVVLVRRRRDARRHATR